MEKINNRQRKFLELLMKETDFVPIHVFAGKLHVSTKTLKGDLKILSRYLKSFEGEIAAKPGRGICLADNIKENMEFLYQFRGSTEGHLISTGERKAEITKELLLSSEQYTSIQKLADKYYVGRSSIVNDLKAVDKWLSRFGVKLEKSSRGTKVLGKEENLRDAIIELLHMGTARLNDPEVCTYREFIHLDEDTLQNLLDIFLPEDIMFVTELLEEIQLSEELEMSDVYYKNLLTHILICIQRVRTGKRVEAYKKEHLKRIEPERYAGAENIAQRIWARYGIDIGEEETEYIYQYICSLTTYGASAWNEQMRDELSGKVAEALTEYVSRILNLQFPREASLMAGLLMHIKPLLNRLEYHIKIKNPFLEEMLESYPQMIGVCVTACRFISEEFQLPPISIDESANLAAYYQTMLVRQASPVTVLVVCHSGFGTSRLLEARLQQQFPSIKIYDVIPSRRLREIDMSPIDFVVSTVPLDITGIPYLLVSSFLLDSDIAAIRNGIYLVEQKRTMGYPKINSVLSEDSIYLDYMPEFEGKPYCETGLQKKLGISIWKMKGQKGAALYVDHVNSKILGYILGTDKEEILLFLSEFYQMAMDEKLLERLLAGRDGKEILEVLRAADKRIECLERIQENEIFLDIECKTKRELMELLADLLVRNDPEAGNNRKTLLRVLWEREEEAFTGIGNGTALVHSVTDKIKQTEIRLVRLSTPVDWAEGKDYPDRVKMVRLVLVFLVPERKAQDDTDRIKELVLKLGRKDNVERILLTEDKSEIISILSA